MSNGKAAISYHDTDRRDSRIIPLQSYGNPPAESKFDGLDYFDFRLNNVSSPLPPPQPRLAYFQFALPTNATTYHCKVYRVPKRITERKQAIAVGVR